MISASQRDARDIASSFHREPRSVRPVGTRRWLRSFTRVNPFGDSPFDITVVPVGDEAAVPCDDARPAGTPPACDGFSRCSGGIARSSLYPRLQAVIPAGIRAKSIGRIRHSIPVRTGGCASSSDPLIPAAHSCEISPMIFADLTDARFVRSLPAKPNPCDYPPFSFSCSPTPETPQTPGVLSRTREAARWKPRW